MATTALLSSAFFGPVQWYQKLYRYGGVLIEDCDSYQKQTYRNRCLIATTKGVQALTVPVAVENSNGRSVAYVSDHGNWRHLHWQALQSAYGESPFFEYYEDDLRPFFTNRWERLYDMNEAIRQTVCQLLDIEPRVELTTAYTAPLLPDGQAPAASPIDIRDFREAIHPKHPAPDPDFVPRRYYQVYEQRHGFLPNLSVLDLLMNMGPESVFWL